jgi:hypothetical protein
MRLGVAERLLDLHARSRVSSLGSSGAIGRAAEAAALQTMAA